MNTWRTSQYYEEEETIYLEKENIKAYEQFSSKLLFEKY